MCRGLDFLTVPPSDEAFPVIGFKTAPQARDDCVIMKGEDECAKFIEAHKECLRAEGFDIR